MKKPYEIYGIPEKRNGFTYAVLPEYATIFGYFVDTHLTPSLTPDKMRIWGKADYWTVLESALLLAGLSPDDEDLYLAREHEKHDEFNDEFNDEFVKQFGKVYAWAHAEKFDAARNYLFLFERSKLAPKASPIEWVKYFSEKISSSPIKNTVDVNEILTYEKWDYFFELEFYEINQTKNIEKQESTRETENLISDLQENPSRRAQQIEMIVAIIAALVSDPLQIPDGGKAKIKKACLTCPRLFTDASFEHAWKVGLKAGYFRLANHDKYSPNK